MKLRIENLATLFLIVVILLSGCSGCGQETVPQEVQMPTDNTAQDRDTLFRDDPTTPQITDEQMPSAQEIRNISDYDGITETGKAPPDDYYGDPLLWIPGAKYKMYFGSRGKYVSFAELPEEIYDRIQKREWELIGMPDSYADVPFDKSNAAHHQAKIEVFTEYMTPLQAAKYLGTDAAYYDAALTFAQRALDENPDGFHTLLFWTKLHYAGNRDLYPKVEEGYQRLIEIKPNSAYVQYRFGEYLLTEGNTKESLVHLKKAVELNPTLLEAAPLAALAKAYYKSGDIPKSIETLKRREAVVTYFSEKRIIQKLIASLEQGNGWIIRID